MEYISSRCEDEFRGFLAREPNITSENITLERLLVGFCDHFVSKYPNTTLKEEAFHRRCCPLDETTKLPTVAIYVLLVLLSPIGLTANSLIMVTVYKVKRLRNTTGYFICNLAFADILLIFEMILFFILNQANVQYNRLIFPSFEVFLGSASLLLVTAVSIERGIAVARPLKYPRYLSEKRAKVLILCIWVYCSVLLVLGVLRIWITNQYYCKIFFYVAVTFSFFLPCVFVVTSYNIIVFSALKTMKMEKKICRALVAISLMNNDTLELETSAPVRSNRCREIKVALKVTTLTCPFVCGWGYFMICNVYELSASYEFQGAANFMLLFLPFIVSSLNPLTYIMFTRTLRQGAWTLISRSHAGNKLYRLVCRRPDTPANPPAMRQRLVPSDRLKQMQFTSEHSRWLEMQNTQNTCI